MNLSNMRETPIKLIESAHIVLTGQLNGVTGTFLLDTGATHCCINACDIDTFKLETEKSEVDAAGAGADGIKTKTSHDNVFSLGRFYNKFKSNDITIIVMDLTHVNVALNNYGAEPINGIIGAEFLIKHDAIIDYKNQKLYLKY